jgi:hypothetical protein
MKTETNRETSKHNPTYSERSKWSALVNEAMQKARERMSDTESCRDSETSNPPTDRNGKKASMVEVDA